MLPGAVGTVGSLDRLETRVPALSRPPVTTFPASPLTPSTLFNSAVLRSATDRVGSTAKAKAAAPATWGVAMLVPLYEA